MTPPIDVAALRAMACRTFAALGECLDAIAQIHEIQVGPAPTDPANTAAICQLLAEAFTPADQAALFADDLATELSRLETQLCATLCPEDES